MKGKATIGETGGYRNWPPENVAVRYTVVCRGNDVYRIEGARVLDGALTGITWPDYSGPVKPLPVPPADPTILDTYMIANTVTLVVLPSGTPIEAQNVRVGWDADSFSWKFSADIFTQAALDLVRPDADGAWNLYIRQWRPGKPHRGTWPALYAEAMEAVTCSG